MEDPYDEDVVSEEEAIPRTGTNRARRTVIDDGGQEQRKAELFRQMEEDREQQRILLRAKEAQSKLFDLDDQREQLKQAIGAVGASVLLEKRLQQSSKSTSQDQYEVLPSAFVPFENWVFPEEFVKALR